MDKLDEVQRHVAKMGEQLLDVVGIPFAQTSELQRQILACFVFGMIFAEGQIRRLSPPDVHALVVCSLIKTFKYSAEQAGAFSTDLIQHSLSKDPNNTHKAIMHRGIDGHRQWQTGQSAQLKQNVLGIFKTLGAAPAQGPG